MFVKMPRNKWLTGKLYSYNANQDKNRKEIKRLIDAGTFVKDDDYDDDGYSTIPQEKRYKQFVSRDSRSEWANKATNNKKNRQVVVEDEEGLISLNDRFKLMDQSDESKGFKITELEPNRNNDKTMATYLLPGAYKLYNNEKILTLQ